MRCWILALPIKRSSWYVRRCTGATDINTTDNDGATALIWSSGAGSPPGSRTPDLSEVPTVNQQDTDGVTALVEAAAERSGIPCFRSSVEEMGRTRPLHDNSLGGITIGDSQKRRNVRGCYLIGGADTSHPGTGRLTMRRLQ